MVRSKHQVCLDMCVPNATPHLSCAERRGTAGPGERGEASCQCAACLQSAGGPDTDIATQERLSRCSAWPRQSTPSRSFLLPSSKAASCHKVWEVAAELRRSGHHRSAVSVFVIYVYIYMTKETQMQG